MTEYKNYKLRKYHGIKSSWLECPSCGQQEFVPYVDEQDNILHHTVGKCNREINCTYHKKPRDFFTENPSIKIGVNYCTKQPADRPKYRSIDTLPHDYVQWSVNKTLSQNGLSNFILWLALQFDQHTLERFVWERLVKEYNLGTSDDVGTIFWQVDIDGGVRTGQILHHSIIGNFDDCKRDKSRNADWVHSRMIRSNELPADYNMAQCLFGEHLLRKYPSKVVALVEGQKSAVIGSGVSPKWLWVATNGKQNLKTDMLRSLKGRKVVVIPDLDAHSDWSAKIPDIARQVGFQYSIFEQMNAVATDEHRQKGYDIADFLLGKFNLNN